MVSPKDDIELRRVRITNLADHARAIELTSYAEVVLAPADADALHPAFSMRQVNAVEAGTQLYARLANAILYGHGSLRAEGSLLMQNRRGQSGLWGYAISGDLPIVLLRVGELTDKRHR